MKTTKVRIGNTIVVVKGSRKVTVSVGATTVTLVPVRKRERAVSTIPSPVASPTATPQEEPQEENSPDAVGVYALQFMTETFEGWRMDRKELFEMLLPHFECFTESGCWLQAPLYMLEIPIKEKRPIRFIASKKEVAKLERILQSLEPLNREEHYILCPSNACSLAECGLRWR